MRRDGQEERGDFFGGVNEGKEKLSFNRKLQRKGLEKSTSENLSKRRGQKEPRGIWSQTDSQEIVPPNEPRAHMKMMLLRSMSEKLQGPQHLEMNIGL